MKDKQEKHLGNKSEVKIPNPIQRPNKPIELLDIQLEKAEVSVAPKQAPASDKDPNCIVKVQKHYNLDLDPV